MSDDTQHPIYLDSRTGRIKCKIPTNSKITGFTVIKEYLYAIAVLDGGETGYDYDESMDEIEYQEDIDTRDLTEIFE